MASKCQVCKHNEAVLAWQPFGPDESALCFTALGAHYRGFPVVKVCIPCKTRICDGTPTTFTYRNWTYQATGEEVKVA